LTFNSATVRSSAAHSKYTMVFDGSAMKSSLWIENVASPTVDLKRA